MNLLAQVSKGKQKKDYKICLYAQAGCGKTQWAAGAPSPLFIDLENGTDLYDVSRIKPKNFHEVMEVLLSLKNEKTEFKTVVVDGLEVAERMATDLVCQENKWDNIEHPGYGKGYIPLVKKWDSFLDLVISVPMNVILICHSQIKTFTDPVKNVAYDRITMRLNEKIAAKTRDSVDCLAFANFETVTSQGVSDKKVKAWDGQKRILYTQRTAGYDAKNRYGITKPLPLTWDSFHEAAQAGNPVDSIRAEILTLISELKDESLKPKVTAAFEKAGADGDELNRILTKLRGVCA